MKILHTSDWHLGRSLYGKKRYDEFTAFLDWLLDTISTQHIDILLVAGDIFDTTTPSNKAQTLYYQFLYHISNTCCRHVVIIAGNHDSPSFLDAPKQLLCALDIHIVSAINTILDNEVIVLKNTQQQAEAIICAIPYLRDKDIRTVEAGETIEEKNSKLVAGVKAHYSAICNIAEQKRKQFKQAGYAPPIIAMGHLFTSGGKTIDGDGVRELYVGTLAYIDENIFPDNIDYLALGHLHIPQRVGHTHHIRYSGSPIPMGFGEAKQEKKVVMVEFAQGIIDIRELPVPSFQRLIAISGNLDAIKAQLEQLSHTQTQAWLEIEYTGKKYLSNLTAICNDIVVNSNIEILRIKNKQMLHPVINTLTSNENLDDLDEYDMFQRCLDAFHIPNEERTDLMHAYQEIVQSVYEVDHNI